MLKGLNAKQLAEWDAFYDAEPFGDVRQDWRHALAGSAVSNAMGAKITAKQLLAVKPPVDPEFLERLKRAQEHAALCRMARKHGNNNSEGQHPADG